MTKKKDVVLREYSRSLTDEDIRYICGRLVERKSGDVGEAVESIQENADMDRLYAASKDADALYDLIDETYEYLDREFTRRIRG